MLRLPQPSTRKDSLANPDVGVKGRSSHRRHISAARVRQFPASSKPRRKIFFFDFDDTLDSWHQIEAVCWAVRTLSWLMSLKLYPLARAGWKSSSEVSKLGSRSSSSEVDTRSSHPSSSLSSSLPFSLHSSASCDPFAPGSSSSSPLLILVRSE